MLRVFVRTTRQVLIDVLNSLKDCLLDLLLGLRLGVSQAGAGKGSRYHKCNNVFHLPASFLRPMLRLEGGEGNGQPPLAAPKNGQYLGLSSRMIPLISLPEPP